MKHDEQPGFLGQHFDDDATPLPNHLQWDAVADGIIGQQPRKRRWPFILFFLTGTLLAAGWLMNSSGVNPQGMFPLPGLLNGSETTEPQQYKSESIRAELSNFNEVDKTVTTLNAPVPNANSNQVPPALYNIGKVNPVKNFTQLADPIDKILSSELLELNSGNDGNKSVEAAESIRVVAALTVPVVGPEWNKELDFNSLNPDLSGVAKATTSAASNQPHLPEILNEKSNAAQLILLAGAGNHAGDVDAGTPLYTSYFSASYRKPTGKQWRWSAGLATQRFVRRSILNRTENVNLYRPGTVDTIFRNTDTGAERIVTKDTIPGLQLTAFTGYGRVTLLTLPVAIGWRTAALGGDIGWDIGIAPGIMLGRSGRSLSTAGEIESVSDQAAWNDQFYLGLSSQISYNYTLNARISLEASVGATHLVQPGITAWNFGLGVGYRLQR